VAVLADECKKIKPPQYPFVYKMTSGSSDKAVLRAEKGLQRAVDRQINCEIDPMIEVVWPKTGKNSPTIGSPLLELFFGTHFMNTMIVFNTASKKLSGPKLKNHEIRMLQYHAFASNRSACHLY
jgi:hypothetical protein